MIHRSRKWRLVIRTVALVVTSVLMLAFAGPVSYALRDDTPKPVSGETQLFSKDHPVADTYVYVTAVPELTRVAAIKNLVNTDYWLPLRGYGNQLFVRTDESRYLFPYDYDPTGGFTEVSEVKYAGKVIPLKELVNADQVVKELAEQGVTVDKEKAMVLSQGEKPSIYRPMVPVMPILAWLWVAALLGLLHILRGRRPTSKQAYAKF